MLNALYQILTTTARHCKATGEWNLKFPCSKKRRSRRYPRESGTAGVNGHHHLIDVRRKEQRPLRKVDDLQMKQEERQISKI